MSETYAALIPTFPLFKGYTLAGAQMLLERGEVKQFAAGELLFREGDPPTFAALVLTGKLQVFVARGGREVVLGDIGAGKILGELAVLCGMNRSASVRIIEPAAILQWDGFGFRRLLLGNAFLSEQILGQALRHLVEQERARIDAALKAESVGGASTGP